jgi:hypothetical protein
MLKKLSSSSAVAIAVFMSQSALAQPFNTFDPVSMAMGGVGVALPMATTANLYNPSLLTGFRADRDEDFAIGLSAGVRAYDQDDLLDLIDDVADDFDNLEMLVDQLNSGMPTDPDALRADIANAGRRLDRSLGAADGKSAQVELGAALMANLPRERWAIGLTTSAQAIIGAKVNYKDSAFLNELINAAENNLPVDYDGSRLDSDAELLGAAIGEFGISFAKRVELFGQDVSLGITPKYVQVETIYYRSRIDEVDSDDIDANDYRSSYGGFNLDIGLLKAFDNGFYTGFVAKNLISRDYDTVELNGEKHTISLRPQLRAGVGYDGGWYRLGVDADLTKNKPVAFEQGSRYIAIGGELSAFGWAHIRAGYRFDTVDSNRSVASIGLGVSPFKVVHFDLAVAGNSDEVGASAQLALTF